MYAEPQSTGGKRIPGSSIPSWMPRAKPAFKDTWLDAVTESLRTATPSIPKIALDGPPTYESLQKRLTSRNMPELSEDQLPLAYAAAMSDYQALNTAVWDLVRESVDLAGAYEVMDSKHCKQNFMIGDLRDGVGFIWWAYAQGKTDPVLDQINALKELNDFPALDGSKAVTRVMLDVHTSRLVEKWSAVAGNDGRQTDKLMDFKARLIMSLPHEPMTAKIVVCRQYLVDALRDGKEGTDSPSGMTAILTKRAMELDMDPGDPSALNVLTPFVGGVEAAGAKATAPMAVMTAAATVAAAASETVTSLTAVRRR